MDHIYNPTLDLDEHPCLSSIISVSIHSSSDYEQSESTGVQNITSFLQGYDPNDALAVDPAPWLNDISHYEARDVASWDSKKCIDWAMQVCTELGIDASTPDLTAFTTVTGQELVSYTESQFTRLLGCNLGPTFFHKLKALLNTREADGYNQFYDRSETVAEDDTMTSEAHSQYYQLEASEDSFTLDSWIKNEDDLIYNDSSPYYYPSNPAASPSSSSSCGSFTSDSSHHTQIKTEREYDGEGMDEESERMEAICSAAGSYPLSPLRKIKAKGRNREREPKNWEYLCRLLSCEQYKEWIKWEDKDDGTFRLTKKDEIAKMWGLRRTELESMRTVKKERLIEPRGRRSIKHYTPEEENTTESCERRRCCQKTTRRRRRSQEEDLTYDNFARGLRYHYKKGALKAVSERQLVYRWGPEALAFLETEKKIQMSLQMHG